MGRLTVSTTVALAALAVAAPAQAQQVVLSDLGGVESRAEAVAVGPDGTIVAAGTVTDYDEGSGEYRPRVALARYRADLSLRGTTVGPSGLGAAVALRPDGRIVVAGSDGGDFVLALYRADGTLERTVTTDFGAYEQAHSVAVAPDGRIVAAGESDGALAVARYHADGTLDAKASFDIGNTGRALAIGPGGRLLIGGGDFVTRLRPDTSLESSFPIAFPVTALALQSDGRIVVAGADGQLALTRLRADGSPDPTFNPPPAQSPFGSAGEGATGVAVQPDGRIVLVGQGFWDPMSGGEGSFVPVARHSASGALISTAAVMQGPDQGATAVALAPDGGVVFAGVGNTWDDGYYGPQRFLVGRG